MEIIVSIVAVSALVLAVFLFLRLQKVQQTLQETLVDKGKLDTELGNVRSRLNEVLQEKSALEAINKQYLSDLAVAETQIQHLKQQLTTQKEELTALQEKFKADFEVLANRLLEDKSKKFTELNREKLGELLNPLNEKIKEFQTKVENVNKEDIERNSALLKQLEYLHKLNQEMSEEARNLTKALKGDAKAQGNWGEMLLEKVLEMSGLRKGIEYTVQASTTNEDGRRLLTDVIIHLPENKILIIDSKVSLLAYERYVSAETDAERQSALKQHIASVKAHIKSLGSKNYQQQYAGKSPDFVLLFIPIEPAFSLAMMHEERLFSEAFENNIVIVTNSTLLATLRTVASIWKQENQNRNALEIAKSAGDMYDKFVGFVSDLEDVGKKIEGTQKSYNLALSKLTGHGGLVSRAQKLKKMGANATKSIPEHLISDEEDT
jgi:DNA recombination protein RmuC